MAPVVVVDDKVERSVTPTRVDGIILSFETNGGKKEMETGQGKEGRKELEQSDREEPQKEGEHNS